MRVALSCFNFGLFQFVPGFYFVQKTFCMCCSFVAGVRAIHPIHPNKYALGCFSSWTSCLLPAAWQPRDPHSLLGCRAFHFARGNVHHPIVYSCHHVKLLDVLLLKNRAMDICFVIFVFMAVCEWFVMGMCSLTALNFYKPWGQHFIKFILVEFAVAGETCAWDSCTSVSCKGGCHFTLPCSGYRNKETADNPDPSVPCWRVFLENTWLYMFGKKHHYSLCCI